MAMMTCTMRLCSSVTTYTPSSKISMLSVMRFGSLVFVNFCLCFLKYHLLKQSHSLTDILELQSQPLTDYLIGVVESKTQPNPATKQMSIQLLNGAKANITNSIKDLTLLHQSLASPSRLPSFNRILDVFEMHRSLFFCFVYTVVDHQIY